MSIVQLKRIALVGMGEDRDRVLDDLQQLGCMELIPRRHAEFEDPHTASAAEVREALQFLMSCPQRRRQFVDEQDFDPVAVNARALELRRRLLELRDEVDGIYAHLERIIPWGDFEFPALDDLGSQRLWFYRVPHHRVREFRELAEPWEVVKRDHTTCYIVVMSPHEPEDTPIQRERIGDRSRHQLEHRLQQVEIEIEKVQEERAQLTHWCTLLARNLALLEDRAALRAAARQAESLDLLFGLEGWVPLDRLGGVRDYALAQGMVIHERDPLPDEKPPTKLENRRGLDTGEALVNFYMTPGYWTWDPSGPVLLSFAVFFAMILSDAGYASVLALLLLAGWKRLGASEAGRWFRRAATLCTSLSMVYGVLTGGYFGVAPPPGSLLAGLALIDLNDATGMMTITIAVGVLHITYANIRNGLRYGFETSALAPIGWAAAICGGSLYAAAALLDVPSLEMPGKVLVVAGLVLVVCFTAVDEKLLPRALKGLLALTRVSAAFGDALSYLRLFALGLASASLAGAFNAMASDMRDAMPGVGLFFALLVLLLGHGLNLVLSLASAVIHGLRLNVIEFFNWGLTEEGRLFRPFRKKETS